MKYAVGDDLHAYYTQSHKIMADTRFTAGNSNIDQNREHKSSAYAQNSSGSFFIKILSAKYVGAQSISDF